MQNVNHAIENLRTQTGLTGLDFDENGNLSILFDDVRPINLHRIDDVTLEVWTAIENFGRLSDPATLRRLLEANYLGEGTGPARLALAPNRDAVALCERVDVRGIDGPGFVDGLIRFLSHAEYWNSPEASRNGPASAPAEEAELASYAIRV